jgi:cytochrome d ubiquinol oxidase subunit II
METYFPALAAIAVMVLVGGYVVLDSFDLGAGMLLMHETERRDRDEILQSTAATRYSSEWWLIAAALVMYFAFPFPFRTLAEGLAAPIAVLIGALVIRGVAAALRRSPDDRAEALWSRIFAISSTIATLAQGFSLGGYLRGFSIVNGQFVGGSVEWAAPFSVLIAAALTTGYALLGSAWLTFQMSGALAEQARRRTIVLSIAASVAMLVISYATLLVHSIVSARWGVSFDGVDWSYFLPMAPLPIAAATGLACAYFSARAGRSSLAFIGAVVAIVAGYGGLVVSVWPYVVPYGFTAAQSAADVRELRLTLLWVAAGVPVLIVFSFLSYAAWRVHMGRPRLLPRRSAARQA